MNTGIAILSYFLIFAGKLVEVSLATTRNVLINRGEKLLGAFIGFFEVLLWLVLVNNVLGTITEDPVKVVVYCLAFCFGNYFGVMLENKLAIGMAFIQAVVPEGAKDELCSLLTSRGFGVTTVKAQGSKQAVDVLMVYLKRKCIPEALELIRTGCPTAMVTVNDVRQMRNGFIKK